jgi:hypothetical protein
MALVDSGADHPIFPMEIAEHYLTRFDKSPSMELLWNNREITKCQTG